VARFAALARVFFAPPCLAVALVDHPAKAGRVARFAALCSLASFSHRLASPSHWSSTLRKAGRVGSLARSFACFALSFETTSGKIYVDWGEQENYTNELITNGFIGTRSARQFTNSPMSPIHHVADSPCRQFINSPIHQFTNSSIHQFTNCNRCLIIDPCTRKHVRWHQRLSSF
jgi:hypothetical protein